MTTPSDVTTPAQGESAPETMCLCGHPNDTHDLIASRYCKATVEGALTRDCMCGRMARRSY